MGLILTQYRNTTNFAKSRRRRGASSKLKHSSSDEVCFYYSEFQTPNALYKNGRCWNHLFTFGLRGCLTIFDSIHCISVFLLRV